MKKQFISAPFWLIIPIFLTGVSFAGQNWPQFRGPGSSGVAEKRHSARSLDHHRERGVGEGNPGPRLVLPHRLGR